MTDTKGRILDAAERLIAQHGLDVSLRNITADAKVNLAAVNYHFQTKEALWTAVVERRFGPINARRLELLDQIERENPDGPLPLESLLEAFLAPPFEMFEDAGEHFRPLMGRLYTLPEEYLLKVFGTHIAPVVGRFGPAFQRAVPELSEIECRWRLIFAIGSLVHLLNWSRMIPVITGGVLDPADTKRVKAELIAFTAAGFRGPKAPKEMQ